MHIQNILSKERDKWSVCKLDMVIRLIKKMFRIYFTDLKWDCFGFRFRIYTNSLFVKFNLCVTIILNSTDLNREIKLNN
jgi:hypothetical protein